MQCLWSTLLGLVAVLVQVTGRSVRQVSGSYHPGYYGQPAPYPAYHHAPLPYGYGYQAPPPVYSPAPAAYYGNVYGVFKDFPGGGSPVRYDYNNRCSRNYVGIKPHPDQQQYYYICQPNCVIFSKCPNHEKFNPSSGRCVQQQIQSLNLPLNRPTCQKEGRFPHPHDCKVYYRCHKNQTEPWLFACPEGTVFSSLERKCLPGDQCPSTEISDSGSYIPQNCELKFPECAEEGTFRSPTDCALYYTCRLQKETGNFLQTRFKCPGSNSFDLDKKLCRPRNEVECFDYVPGPVPGPFAPLPYYPPYPAALPLYEDDYDTGSGPGAGKEQETAVLKSDRAKSFEKPSVNIVILPTTTSPTTTTTAEPNHPTYSYPYYYPSYEKSHHTSSKEEPALKSLKLEEETVPENVDIVILPTTTTKKYEYVKYTKAEIEEEKVTEAPKKEARKSLKGLSLSENIVILPTTTTAPVVTCPTLPTQSTTKKPETTSTTTKKPTTTTTTTEKTTTTTTPKPSTTTPKPTTTTPKPTTTTTKKTTTTTTEKPTTTTTTTKKPTTTTEKPTTTTTVRTTTTTKATTTQKPTPTKRETTTVTTTTEKPTTTTHKPTTTTPKPTTTTEKPTTTTQKPTTTTPKPTTTTEKPTTTQKPTPTKRETTTISTTEKPKTTLNPTTTTTKKTTTVEPKTTTKTSTTVTTTTQKPTTTTLKTTTPRPTTTEKTTPKPTTTEKTTPKPTTTEKTTPKPTTTEKTTPKPTTTEKTTPKPTTTEKTTPKPTTTEKTTPKPTTTEKTTPKPTTTEKTTPKPTTTEKTTSTPKPSTETSTTQKTTTTTTTTTPKPTTTTKKPTTVTSTTQKTTTTTQRPTTSTPKPTTSTPKPTTTTKPTTISSTTSKKTTETTPKTTTTQRPTTTTPKPTTVTITTPKPSTVTTTTLKPTTTTARTTTTKRTTILPSSSSSTTTTTTTELTTKPHCPDSDSTSDTNTQSKCTRPSEVVLKSLRIQQTESLQPQPPQQQPLRQNQETHIHTKIPVGKSILGENLISGGAGQSPDYMDDGPREDGSAESGSSGQITTKLPTTTLSTLAAAQLLRRLFHVISTTASPPTTPRLTLAQMARHNLATSKPFIAHSLRLSIKQLASTQKRSIGLQPRVLNTTSSRENGIPEDSEYYDGDTAEQYADEETEVASAKAASTTVAAVLPLQPTTTTEKKPEETTTTPKPTSSSTAQPEYEDESGSSDYANDEPADAENEIPSGAKSLEERKSLLLNLLKQRLYQTEEATTTTTLATPTTTTTTTSSTTSTTTTTVEPQTSSTTTLRPAVLAKNSTSSESYEDEDYMEDEPISSKTEPEAKNLESKLIVKPTVIPAKRHIIPELSFNLQQNEVVSSEVKALSDGVMFQGVAEPLRQPLRLTSSSLVLKPTAIPTVTPTSSPTPSTTPIFRRFSIKSLRTSTKDVEFKTETPETTLKTKTLPLRNIPTTTPTNATIFKRFPIESLRTSTDNVENQTERQEPTLRSTTLPLRSIPTTTPTTATISRRFATKSLRISKENVETETLSRRQPTITTESSRILKTLKESATATSPSKQNPSHRPRQEVLTVNSKPWLLLAKNQTVHLTPIATAGHPVNQNQTETSPFSEHSTIVSTPDDELSTEKVPQLIVKVYEPIDLKIVFCPKSCDEDHDHKYDPADNHKKPSCFGSGCDKEEDDVHKHVAIQWKPLEMSDVASFQNAG